MDHVEGAAAPLGEQDHAANGGLLGERRPCPVDVRRRRLTVAVEAADVIVDDAVVLAVHLDEPARARRTLHDAPDTTVVGQEVS